MLRNLEEFVDSPAKKVVMVSIVGFLAFGLKEAMKSTPLEVRNLNNEKGKVSNAIILILCRAREKETWTDSSGSA